MDSFRWLTQIQKLNDEDIKSLSQKIDFIYRKRMQEHFDEDHDYMCTCFFITYHDIKDALSFCIYHFGKKLDLDKCPCKCQCEACTYVIN